MRVTVLDVDSLTRNWWVVLIRGIAGILFGIVTVLAPGLSLTALVLLFGAYAFADGVLAMITGIRARGEVERWWVMVLEGIIGIAAGLATLIWPGITAVVLLIIIATWAIITGIFEIAAAIRLRKVIKGEWLLGLTGVASIAFGVMLIFFPAAGALAFVLWIGAFALVFGALLVALAFRLRSWGKSETLHAAPRVA